MLRSAFALLAIGGLAAAIPLSLAQSTQPATQDNAAAQAAARAQAEQEELAAQQGEIDAADPAATQSARGNARGGRGRGRGFGMPQPALIIPTEKIELFDGLDFTNWVPGPASFRNPSGTWYIQNGVMVCTGQPNSYLRTYNLYAQYKLTVEWRFTRPGNTGILVHIDPASVAASQPATPAARDAADPTRSDTWPTCIECQGAHDHQGDFWVWSGAKVREPFTQRNGILMTKPSAEKPVGQWNTYQVLCRDDTVTIVVNGTEMNKLTGVAPRQGCIGIQAEGGGFEVRKVTIEPLTP
jgi:hypothetical protein